MAEPLFPFYERELLFLRQLVAEYAARHPQLGRRLQLEWAQSTDAHVERLLQSFALLAARVQHRVHDDFPEIVDALLGVLAPHALAPVPSMALVQFQLDPTRSLSYVVPRHSPLRTPPVDGVPCRYRTVYETPLWPITLQSASFQPPPFSSFPPGVAPPGAAAVLRLRFECAVQTSFKELLSLDRLRLFLDGDPPVVALLYEFLFCHAQQVVFRPRESASEMRLVSRAAERSLLPVGFEAEEGMLPYAPSLSRGYRLLTEYFAYPAKFQFVDVVGWQEVRRAGFERTCEVAIFFDRTHRRLEQAVSAANLLLGCTPVINLFDPEPVHVPVDRALHEYPLVPDPAAPHGFEVYQVNTVVSKDPAGKVVTEYQPFDSIRHERQGAPSVYWQAVRHGSLSESDRGTSVSLQLTDLAMHPRPPQEPVLMVEVTCTNRDLPGQLAAESHVALDLEAAAPLFALRCVQAPTPPLRPRRAHGTTWKLLSQLSLNHLSLTETPEGLESFRELLKLYHFNDAGTTADGDAAQQAEAVLAIGYRRIIGRIADELATGFGRGIEVKIRFDESKIPTGVYLFASVLEHFLAEYVSSESFCQFVALDKRGEEIKRWPPRAGTQRPQ